MSVTDVHVWTWLPMLVCTSAVARRAHQMSCSATPCPSQADPEAWLVASQSQEFSKPLSSTLCYKLISMARASFFSGCRNMDLDPQASVANPVTYGAISPVLFIALLPQVENMFPALGTWQGSEIICWIHW